MPLGGVRVGGDGNAQSGRLLDRSAQLFGTEGDIARVVADRLVGTRDEQLDPVGAVLHLLANGLANLLGPVDHQAVSNHRLLGRQEVDVAATAGDRDVVPRAGHSRADEDSVFDRPADFLIGVEDVRIAHDPNAGPAGQQIPLQRRQPHEGLVRRRALQVGVLVVVAVHQRVLVAVDHPRHERGPGKLDDASAGRNHLAATDRRDPFALHHHHDVGARFGRGPVDQPVGDQRRRLSLRAQRAGRK